jgi:hypothetical protein
MSRPLASRRNDLRVDEIVDRGRVALDEEAVVLRIEDGRLVVISGESP